MLWLLNLVQAYRSIFEFTWCHRAEVTLSLELAPGVSLSRALTSYPVDRTGGRVTVDLGDLFAEERRDVLLELQLPAASEGLQAVARAELRGFAVSEKRLQQVQRPLVLERRAGAPVAASHPQAHGGYRDRR